MLIRTDGTSPAFLKELFRRAVLLAQERGATGEPLPVVGNDFERALRELLQAGVTSADPPRCKSDTTTFRCGR